MARARTCVLCRQAMGGPTGWKQTWRAHRKSCESICPPAFVPSHYYFPLVGKFVRRVSMCRPSSVPFRMTIDAPPRARVSSGPIGSPSMYSLQTAYTRRPRLWLVERGLDR